MRLNSELTPKTYIQKLRRRIGSFVCFGDERFTGFTIGGFFSIVYHSGFEWNRRVTNEKNRAIGYVRQNPNGEGSQVRLIRLRGLTNPLSLLAMFVCFYGFGWLFYMLHGGNVDPTLWQGISAGVSALMTAAIALLTALAAQWTERGRYGRMVLMALLRHPEDPYHHLDPNDQS